ncbi:MAG: hypothetical protein ABIY50_02395 [Ignavibacteria bacterium]
MKKIILAITILIISSNISVSQYLQPLKNLNQFTIKDHKFNSTFNALPSTGASVGFNMGVASIEGEVGFAIGVFAELKSGGISFVPQANYWKAKNQSNFEIAGLARAYLTETSKNLTPYIDGGAGVNFYNSDKSDFTKLSILIGSGIELRNLGTSFNLLIDGKYKLIINDGGNISCFIFTAGLKFPFK